MLKHQTLKKTRTLLLSDLCAQKLLIFGENHGKLQHFQNLHEMRWHGCTTAAR